MRFRKGLFIINPPDRAGRFSERGEVIKLRTEGSLIISKLGIKRLTTGMIKRAQVLRQIRRDESDAS